MAVIRHDGGPVVYMNKRRSLKCSQSKATVCQNLVPASQPRREYDWLKEMSYGVAFTIQFLSQNFGAAGLGAAGRRGKALKDSFCSKYVLEKLSKYFQILLVVPS